MKKERKKYIYTAEDAWGKGDTNLLRQLYPATDNKIIAEKINRSVSAVRNRAIKLGLKKSNRYWTQKQIDFMVKNWHVLSAAEIGQKLSKTRWAVINKYREVARLH